MPDDFIVDQEISAKLSQHYLIFDRVADEEALLPKYWSFFLWKPIKIVTDTSVEVFQVVSGLQLDHCEVIYVEVVVLPALNP